MTQASATQAVSVEEITPFGRLRRGPDRGSEIRRFVLSNRSGLRVVVCEYGASLLQLWAPDRDGRPADIALGFDHLSGYEGSGAYHGATVGRVANRIARASFRLDGSDYRLATNNGPHHLHGGPAGYHRRRWNGKILLEDKGAPAVAFSLIDPDGSEGYPGRVQVSTIYSLGADNTLEIRYHARCDRPTPINLSNHTYWSLNPGTSVAAQQLLIAAEHYLPVDEGLIPDGRLLPVAGTAMDFREARLIGSGLAQLPQGFDHNYVLGTSVLDSGAQREVAFAASLRDPGSGRRLDLYTDQPGLQFYSGNFLDGSECGKQGFRYQRHQGLCLEPQGFPDAINREAFPSVILRPGQTYRHTSRYRFSTCNAPF